ncbi:MAG: YicC family protein [Clostridiales bacterium]|jgi:uncharacterized protein (TIGR00255 family)|nr:YicC family protein [Clostridiales bacterium]
MNSMTGYGKGESVRGGRSLTIELKSVNNRYLEINSRLPKMLAPFDAFIRAKIGAAVKRGCVDVFFNYENADAGDKTVFVDTLLAGEYVRAAKRLRDEFFLEGDFNTTALLRSPEVVKTEGVRDDPRLLEEMTAEALTAALDALIKMRAREGETIKSSLAGSVKNIAAALADAEKRAPLVVEQYRVKLAARIKEALAGVEIDSARLLNEVAFFADRADVNEEISRLRSHIAQFTATLNEPGESGRKLDFLSQEMNREINTLGSKSNDSELTKSVLYMKNELEKIKEQIRNAE